MRLHTTNRRKIQDATKGAKLRGLSIGSGNVGPKALKAPKSLRPIAWNDPRLPARLSAGPTVLGIQHSMAKRGVFSRASRDVLGLKVGKVPAYFRMRNGEIRKLVKA